MKFPTRTHVCLSVVFWCQVVPIPVFLLNKLCNLDLAKSLFTVTSLMLFTTLIWTVSQFFSMLLKSWRSSTSLFVVSHTLHCVKRSNTRVVSFSNPTNQAITIAVVSRHLWEQRSLDWSITGSEPSRTSTEVCVVGSATDTKSGAFSAYWCYRSVVVRTPVWTWSHRRRQDSWTPFGRTQRCQLCYERCQYHHRSKCLGTRPEVGCSWMGSQHWGWVSVE